MATEKEKEQAGKALNIARQAYANLALRMARAKQNGEPLDFEKLRLEEKELSDRYLEAQEAFFKTLES